MDQLAALHPIGRLGQPEEVAELVLFLGSPAASFMTGSYDQVGGWLLSRTIKKSRNLKLRPIFIIPFPSCPFLLLSIIPGRKQYVYCGEAGISASWFHQ
ncbi:SDR family oxidoreductase [Chitinophaga sancti]|uniref:SDR family oxidoreductase n=1 Tax=Chitinophaga sancti TaxID=1004 RepID=UPI002A74C736|nr:SDR family oxidoreductase [Chitinophaga sancti]WPQ66570.1 SDR family oxidoreductase [Chitinophaga sancti]